MSMRDITLMRAVTLLASASGGAGDLLEHAVLPGAHAVELLVGLEVDVRGALVDGVQQDLVDEADDGRVVDLVAARCPRARLVVASLTSRFSRSRSSPPAIDVSSASSDFTSIGVELVVLDDDRLDAHAGGELDLVDGLQPGRVGDADEQPPAALEQRQHAVAVHQLVVDGRAASRSISMASRSSTGTPNSWQAAPAMSRGSARFFSTR
jgi:hypothetical protein